jgi:DhnA family fructose-bisphosphate aldolase class Ia
MYSGQQRRLNRLFGRRPCIWLPIDDALLVGPDYGLADTPELLRPDVTCHLDAILAFRGVVEQCGGQFLRLPVIINVSASTTRGDHVDKVLVTSVESAIRVGADAIAFHINLGAPTENAMLRRLGKAIEAADRFGLPVIVISYPRGQDLKSKGDDNYLTLRDNDPEAYMRLVRHSVRLGVELGASVVKTVYTEHEETFAAVVDAALGVPVIMAGGPKSSDEDAWARAEGALRAGAAGVAFGRQVFLNSDPTKFLDGLRRIVDAENISPGRTTSEAMLDK